MSDPQPWQKPVLVLVPGAWNTVGSFNLVVPFLNTAGYTTRCVELPSVGANPPLDGIQPDIDAIRVVIQKEIDAAQDVLLLMHDYASIPGGEAVKGLDKATRLAEGAPGGVTCLFYAAAPILPSGSCLADLFSGGEGQELGYIISRDQKVAVLERPTERLCPEIEPELAREYVESLRPHSYRTFLDKTTWEPYRDLPFYCLFCKLDKVISLARQRALAQAPGIKFKSTTINAGHCPFLAQPEDTAKAIRRASKESTYYSGVIARDYGFRAGSK